MSPAFTGGGFESPLTKNSVAFGKGGYSVDYGRKTGTLYKACTHRGGVKA